MFRIRPFSLASRIGYRTGVKNFPRKSIPSLIAKRSITNAFQHGVPPPHPMPPVKKVRAYRWPIILALAMLVSGVAFRYYTAHNYPPEVASKLRKGLRAELDGGGKGKPDYKLALQYYLEALEEADNSNLHYLSDEYTGLQIKIAEMYEKLGMEEEARLIYRELGTSYIQALTDGTAVSAEVRPHMIQRDLRVALKTAISEATTNPEVAKMGLLVHFTIAQMEVANRDPAVAELINSEKTRANFNISIPVEGAPSKFDTKAWEPFRDELFSARDSTYSQLAACSVPRHSCFCHHFRVVFWIKPLCSGIPRT
ncbi:Mgr3p [Sugiyamaella lignohabitans]|uniref:Mgr3p n=1 Tax=Sugiyamaella lignohabitans TaxID=796027 RepID=A0A167CF07_9ASCO|nr:Mgr3p [Sugiyamaella lignohabitans]ANB11604.1 Mgr3p [Sugiyamaella lignohabitans]